MVIYDDWWGIGGNNRIPLDWYDTCIQVEKLRQIDANKRLVLAYQTVVWFGFVLSLTVKDGLRPRAAPTADPSNDPFDDPFPKKVSDFCIFRLNSGSKDAIFWVLERKESPNVRKS